MVEQGYHFIKPVTSQWWWQHYTLVYNESSPLWLRWSVRHRSLPLNLIQGTTHNSNLVPAVHSEGRSDGGKNAWFQLFAHARNFPGNVFYCGILLHNGHLQWYWRQVLISLGLMHNLPRWRIQLLDKPLRNVHVVIVLLFTLRRCARWCINWKQ